jgi:hypothetical protein
VIAAVPDWSGVRTGSSVDIGYVATQPWAWRTDEQGVAVCCRVGVLGHGIVHPDSSHERRDALRCATGKRPYEP